MTTYSQEFKEAMVAKLLHPNGKSVVELSEETGVSKGSLYKWKESFQDNALELKQGLQNMTNENAQQIRPQNWSAESKLQAVTETSIMTEEQVGEYCRQKGIYSTHLDSWRSALIAGIQPSHDKSQKSENLQLKAKVKDLTKELARKEKALAETAALLILKKKVNLLWGDAKDD